jgi:arylsulfate sulfotransferase
MTESGIPRPRAPASSVAVVAFGLAAIALALFLIAPHRGRKAEAEGPPVPPTADIGPILDRIERQKGIDARLAAELEGGTHPWTAPLVILDPYGAAPLSALLLFSTETPSRISLRVPGKAGRVPFAHAFGGYRTRHLLPVYGLVPDATNEVEVRATAEGGGSSVRVVPIRTEALPASLEAFRIDVLKYSPGELQPGVTILSDGVPKVGFDETGAVRFVLDLPALPPSQYSFGGRMILATGSTHFGDVVFYEADCLGRIYGAASAPFGVHHDIEPMGGERFLVAGSADRPSVEDLIYELDMGTGKAERVLDLAAILDPGRPSPYRSDSDWLHLNKVSWSARDGSVVVSGRNQSAVAKLSCPEGRISWILGNHEDWLPGYAKYFLYPEGEGFSWPVAQHFPVELPDQDGDPHTLDLLLFDNHGILAEASAASAEPYSRIVQYRIDERRRRVREVREFGESFGPELFADARGSAQPLPNGGVLGCFNLLQGHRAGSARVVELRPAGKGYDLLFDAELYVADGSYFQPYRATRRELYSSADDDFGSLRPIRDLIAPEVKSRAARP